MAFFHSEADMKHPSGYTLIRRHLRRYPHALRQHLLQELNRLVTYEPVIGIMGKTGVGKSSLCNALFRSEVCTVNAVEACTRQPQRVRLRFGSHYLTLVDLPGVGESVTRDGEYRELYRDLMPQLDMVLWVLKADDRAFAVEVSTMGRSTVQVKCCKTDVLSKLLQRSVITMLTRAPPRKDVSWPRAAGPPLPRTAPPTAAR